MNIFVYENVEPKWWNSLVASVPEGTIYQTTYWAEYIRKRLNLDPVYMVAKDNEGKTSSLLLLWREKIDLRTRYDFPFSSIIKYSLKKLNLGYLCGYYGPIFFEPINEYAPKVVSEELRKLIKKTEFFGMRFLILPIHHNRKYYSLLERDGFLEKTDRKKWATIFIDLGKDINTLWCEIKSSARKCIKKCLKDGVVVDLLRYEELSEYERLLLESRKRLKIPLPPHYPNRTMWNVLKRDQNCLEVFTARKNGEILGAMGVISFNGIIFEIASAQSDESYRRKIYVNDLIKWEVIKWGNKNGHRLYDLAGFAPCPTSDKERGIRHFKEKWGGKYIEYSMFLKTRFPYCL